MSLNLEPYPKSTGTPVREKPMEVLCLGLSRTGTMSLYAALLKLGYTPYHMIECTKDRNNNSLQQWEKALKAKLYGEGKMYQGRDFENMLWRFDAVTDAPAVCFADELLQAYPNAKVILSTRDIENWLPSMERSYYEILSWKTWSILQFLDRQYLGHYIPLLRMILESWTQNDWQNRDKLCQAFLQHYSHIQDTVPREKLLEFQPHQGWSPLCKFLGKPIPDGEFPRINEGNFTAGLHRMLYWRRLKALTMTWIASLVTVGVGGAVLSYYLKK